LGLFHARWRRSPPEDQMNPNQWGWWRCEYPLVYSIEWEHHRLNILEHVPYEFNQRDMEIGQEYTWSLFLKNVQFYFNSNTITIWYR
jgi:hypothetical protein